MDSESNEDPSQIYHKEQFMEIENDNDRIDIFQQILNLNNISEHQDEENNQIHSQRMHSRRDFSKILNSSSSNQRLILSSPKYRGSRQNSERIRIFYETENSFDEGSYRKSFKKRQQSFSIENTIKDSSSSISQRSQSKSYKNILPLQYREECGMEEEKKFGCHCKRSHCLKLYCQCFQKQLFCTENCNCYDCGNMKGGNQKQHKNAVIKALGRNAHGFQYEEKQIQRNGFSLGVQLQEVKKGCKCKRTHCEKKYCECLNNGKFCGIFCRCQDCHNTQFYQKKKNELQ